MRLLAAAFVALLGVGAIMVQAANAADCAPVVSLSAHSGTTLRYALHAPKGLAGATALVLLPGGGGAVALDAGGCPRALAGNSLIRSIPRFLDDGFAAALVDAPSDYQGEDGLADFRAAPAHAADLSLVIADLRRKGAGAVWLIGTSRGTISAANAAARLTGAGAADGLVLTSVVTVGQAGARKAFVAQTVFDLPLDAIRQPTLIVGHESDRCLRSPASQMQRLAGRLTATKPQVMLVTGGPGGARPAGLEACEGRSPHGFLGQEAEVAAGIGRFIRQGRY